ncbi:uncharacterized protein LOC141640812 [Silene latifolia]|uniref:uncharacterized protein LOC141640812 n=1 Tax=Silene latifolia TaxID=37657 RepID=UPI003D77182A
MSKGKSNVYFNGVSSEIRKEIVQVSGCIESQLPFKYLGVPIKPSKLSIKDCQPLIDKVLERIRQLGTKKLSYAGDWIFLWHGGTEYARTPTVAWSKICTNQKEGGLGLRDEYTWNKAALGKLVWWVQAHPSKLWVQWVHNVYLKGQLWEDYNPPQEASWTWKKVCKLKREFQPAYNQNEWINVPGKEYTIKKGYLWLRQGFNAKDKLLRLGISLDSSCCICAQEEESPQHLFIKCQYSRRVLQRIQEWMGVKMSVDNTQNWWQHRRFTRLKNGVLNSILNATMYYIWKQRNESRHESTIISPGRCVVMIQGDIRSRIQQQSQGIMARKDMQWIEKLM